jgi:hypothetical protein
LALSVAEQSTRRKGSGSGSTHAPRERVAVGAAAGRLGEARVGLQRRQAEFIGQALPEFRQLRHDEDEAIGGGDQLRCGGQHCLGADVRRNRCQRAKHIAPAAGDDGLGQHMGPAERHQRL